MQKHEQPKVEYEQPEVVDYGSLLELTLAAHAHNRDVHGGPPNTAYPS